MELKQEQINKVWEQMAVNEELIGELYGIYAGKFPSHREFWQILSQEENGHAGQIRVFGSKVEEGSVFIDKNRFPLMAIRIFSDFVRREIDNARKGKLELLSALSIALWIERALIERLYVEVFKTDLFELKDFLEKLRMDEERHLKMVRKEYDKNRGDQS